MSNYVVFRIDPDTGKAHRLNTVHSSEGSVQRIVKNFNRLQKRLASPNSDPAFIYVYMEIKE